MVDPGDLDGIIDMIDEVRHIGLRCHGDDPANISGGDGQFESVALGRQALIRVSAISSAWA